MDMRVAARPRNARSFAFKKSPSRRGPGIICRRCLRPFGANSAVRADIPVPVRARLEMSPIPNGSLASMTIEIWPVAYFAA